MSPDVRPADHKEFSSLLHSILFGYEQLVAKMFQGDHQKVMPYLYEEMGNVIGTDDFTLVDPDKDLGANFDRFVRYLSNDNFLKGLAIEEMGDGKYVFTIEECSFATSGVHDTLDMRSGTCPFGVMAATALTQALKDGRYFDIERSEFSDKGSKTFLEVR